MTTVLSLPFVLCAAFVLYVVTVLRPRGLLNVNAIFVYIQMIMALGSFSLLEPGNPADTAYGYVLVVSMLGYFVASAITLSVGQPASTVRPPVVRVRPTVGVWVLIALSSAVVVLYYYSVGYSALLRGLTNSLSGQDADIAGQRLDSYSGTTYLFPGYVNQFKNVLLPALVLVVLTYWRSVRQRHLVVTTALVGLALFGLLGTGQRGAFIQFLATTVVFLYFVHGRRLPGGVVRLAAVGGLVVVTSTIALGRSNDSLQAGATLGDRAYAAATEFGSRVFQDQQFSAVAGFRYIYDQPVQWGREWLQGLLGILPSSPGTDLPNRIYAILYGTDRGTAPPGIWGSVYHNLGWFGVLVVPPLLGVALATLTKTSLDAVARNTLEVVGLAGTSVSLGFWAAGGPEAILNTGLVAYLFLWWWGRRIRTAAAAEPRPVPTAPSPTGRLLERAGPR